MPGMPRFEIDPQNLRQVPKYQPFNALPVNPVDASIAEVHSQAAKGLADVTDVITKIYSERVKQEATLAGQEAGASPDFQASSLPAADSWTVANQAYRQGAATSYLARLELDRSDFFSKQVLDYQQKPDADKDPMALTESLRAYVDGTAANLPVDMRLNYQQQSYAKMLPLTERAVLNKAEWQQQTMVEDEQAVLKRLGMQVLDSVPTRFDFDEKTGKPLEASKSLVLAHDTAKAQYYTAILNSKNLTDPQKELMMASLGHDLREATKNRMGEQLRESEAFKKAQADRLVERYLDDFDNAQDKEAYYRTFVNQAHTKWGFDSLEEQNKAASVMEAALNNRKRASLQATQEVTFQQAAATAYRQQQIEDAVKSHQPGSEKAALQFAQEQSDISGDKEKWGRWLGTLGYGADKDALQQARLRQNVTAVQTGKMVLNLDSPGNKKVFESAVDGIFDSGNANGQVIKINSPLPGFAISSNFGARKAPTPGASTYHDGIDIAAPEGTPVKAPLSGRVVQVANGTAKGFGSMVVVRAGDGTVHTFGHIQGKSIRVKEGDIVQAGQTLASVGHEGVATGSHLHWRIHDGSNRPVNPKAYMGKVMQAAPLSLPQQLEQATRLAADHLKAGDRHVLTLQRLAVTGKPDERVLAANNLEEMEKLNIQVSLPDQVKNYLHNLSYQVNTLGKAPAAAVQELAVYAEPGKGDMAQAGMAQQMEGLAEKQFWKNKKAFEPHHKFTIEGLSVTTPSWFFGMPVGVGMRRDVPPVMRTEFTNRFYDMYKSKLIAGIAPDKAYEKASQEIQQLYGWTDVTGNTMFAERPPETTFALAEYSRAQNAAWIKGQLGLFIKRHGLAIGDVAALDFVDNQGGYHVYAKDKNGGFRVLTAGDGRTRMVFKPDRAREKNRLTNERKKEQQAKAANWNPGTAVYNWATGLMPQ